MKIVDLHPEDLFDKELRGELTDSERARLEAHLERCSTCRFEREVRADFADELAGPRSRSRREVGARAPTTRRGGFT
jgi:anti-sigma factor RsiW